MRDERIERKRKKKKTCRYTQNSDHNTIYTIKKHFPPEEGE
jgi:hypothetical protein